jgi:hypothetical protein
MALMSFGGIPNAEGQKVRVYYEGSDQVYKGMALAYNQDTTDNWLNVDKADYAAEYDSSTAEGNQNEGKVIRVEKPATANLKFLAGFVCGGFNVGKTGPCEVDVWVPNGAIVEVRGTESFTIGDRIYVADGDYEVTNVPQAGGFCGYAMETVDRSSAEGILLARVFHPQATDEMNVTESVTSSPRAVTVADAGTVFDNSGATGAVTFTLPTAASAKGLEYTFSIVVAQDVVIDPNGGEVIYVGNDTAAFATTNTLTLTPADACDMGMNITLVSNGTGWVVKSANLISAAKFVIG